MFVLFKVLLIVLYSLLFFIFSLVFIEILKQVENFLINVRNNYMQKAAFENIVDTLSKIISYISLLKLTIPVLVVLQIILLTVTLSN